MRTSAYQFEVAVNERRVCVCICDEVAKQAKQAGPCLDLAAVEHQAVHRFEMAIEIQQAAIVQESNGGRVGDLLVGHEAKFGIGDAIADRHSAGQSRDAVGLAQLKQTLLQAEAAHEAVSPRASNDQRAAIIFVEAARAEKSPGAGERIGGAEQGGIVGLGLDVPA